MDDAPKKSSSLIRRRFSTEATLETDAYPFKTFLVYITNIGIEMRNLQLLLLILLCLYRTQKFGNANTMFIFCNDIVG